MQLQVAQETRLASPSDKTTKAVSHVNGERSERTVGGCVYFRPSALFFHLNNGSFFYYREVSREVGLTPSTREILSPRLLRRTCAVVLQSRHTTQRRPAESLGETKPKARQEQGRRR